MKKLLFVNMASLLFPVSLMAHHGHGDTDGFSITHYFTEPIHAITSVSILLVFAAVLYYRFKKRKSKG